MEYSKDVGRDMTAADTDRHDLIVCVYGHNVNVLSTSDEHGC